MKIGILLVVIASFILCIAGCGEKKQTSDEASTQQSGMTPDGKKSGGTSVKPLN